MLIYTYKLDNYVRKKILPKILLVPNKYIFKGSFKRRMPYITDIDIINNASPEINNKNVYDEILKLLDSINNEKDIILVWITCGTDDRFKINMNSDKQLDQIRDLLDESELKNFDEVLEKYSDNNDKKFFYINELIWEKYKIRWTPTEIQNNKKFLPGNLMIKFSDVCTRNNFLLQYFIKIQWYWVGFDVITNYIPTNLSRGYHDVEEYQLKLSNYAKDYYYMLFPLRTYYYKIDTNISKELETIIDKKFGLYKQLMVQINNYQTLYKTNNLNINMAKEIVTNIIRDIKYLPVEFKSNTIIEIQKVSENNAPNVKMEKWAILLNILLEELNATVNEITKPYFFKYLEKLPEDMQNRYYYNWKQVNSRNNTWRRIY